MNQRVINLAPDNEALASFDGKFSEAMRERFRAHRRYLGISHQQLGAFFQISWSTIRKWENGKTTACQCRSIKLIKRFLNGEFDMQICAQYTSGKQRRLSGDYQNIEVSDCAERVSKLYYLSLHQPELRYKVKRMLMEAVNRATAALLTTENLS